MASIMGNTGNVSYQVGAQEVFVHLNGWTLDYARDEHDITEFGSSGWKSKTVGPTKITGTLSGFYQDSAEDALVESEANADGATAVLTHASGKTYTITAGCDLTNISFNTELGAPNTWTAAFTADIAPVIA
jgi:hypothetical protein